MMKGRLDGLHGDLKFIKQNRHHFGIAISQSILSGTGQTGQLFGLHKTSNAVKVM